MFKMSLINAYFNLEAENANLNLLTNQCININVRLMHLRDYPDDAVSKNEIDDLSEEYEDVAWKVILTYHIIKEFTI